MHITVAIRAATRERSTLLYVNALRTHDDSLELAVVVLRRGSDERR